MAPGPSSFVLRLSIGGVVAGVLLAACAVVGGPIGALAALLGQVCLGLGVSLGRGTRPWGRAAVRGDALALLAAWAVVFAAAALLLAWPLGALGQGGGLGAVLGLGAAASALLIGVWRTWPLWRGVERESGSLAARWRQLPEQDLNAWRGLAVAALVGTAVGGAVLLAWPGLLAGGRTWVAVGYALVSIPVHLLLQRTPAPDVPAHAASGDDPRRAALPIDGTIGASAASGTGGATDAAALLEGDLDAQLFEAARGGRVDRALALIEAGAHPLAPPAEGARDQRSLPILAAVLPDLRLLRALIGHGADLNDASAGMTPLLAATRDSWHGRPDAVMTLLANGADPRAADTDGNTPLHHAARSSDPGVAALLRDAAAEIDALNHDGLTPLAVACQAGNWRMAKFLLERGARPEPQHGQPVLLAAAGTEEDDPAGVMLLLRSRARVDGADGRGRTALHEAAQAGHADIVAALLAAHADVKRRDALGRTAWLDAARSGRGGVLERLSAAGADVSAVDAEGRNALMLVAAADTVSPGLVRRLLELGVDPQRADAEGSRAVDLAAGAGRWAIVGALDPDYPLPAAVADAAGEATVDERAPIVLVREGLQGGRLDGLQAVARLCSADELGALLHDPAIIASSLAPAWLLLHGANAEVRDPAGDTPVFAWLARGAEGVGAVQPLLRHGASPAGAGGLARYLAACAHHDQASRGLEQFALELLDRGADPFAASSAGDPPLSLAVRLGWMRLVERLLGIGANLEARDSHGMSALHLATALGREAALRRLIMAGASPDARAADGQTPLGVALSTGRQDLADWLDWKSWRLPRRALRASDVAGAAMVGDTDAVRRLLDLGLAVDAVDAQGCTGLLRAAGGGHAATVALLLARGADPQHAANSGATPLSAAVSMRQSAIVSALLDAGAGIEHRLPGGVTVLMLACALGLPDIAARLLTTGANVHAGDAQGLAPLHCAALYGFTSRDRPRLVALFDTLLLAGAEPDQLAAGSVTPLLLLLGARAEPGTACEEGVVMAGLVRLLDEDVSLDVQDPRGFGPLHLAALHGLPLIVQRLLRAGADPDLRDTLNRTPREIAVMRGFIDVAAEFAPAVPGSSMARFLREPQ